MARGWVWFLLAAGAVSGLGLGAADLDRKQLELSEEVVCRVNTEVISKQDLEQGMFSLRPEQMGKLVTRRNVLKREGNWDEQAQNEFDAEYLPLARLALKELVKERLMFQEAKKQDVKPDKDRIEKLVQMKTEDLRQRNLLNQPGVRIQDIRKAITENETLHTFKATLANILDFPTRPQIEAYYKEHLAEYQRKEAVQVRIIEIKKVYLENGTPHFREDAGERAEKLRQDIVEFSADFATVAKDHSDSEKALKDRGGLLLGKDNDTHIVPDEQVFVLSRQIKRLKNGEVSKVFDYDEQTLAIIKVEEKRPAGPRPLDSTLYQELYDLCLKRAFREKEEAWFKEAVKKSLILNSAEKPFPANFFFAEEGGSEKAGAQ